MIYTSILGYTVWFWFMQFISVGLAASTQILIDSCIYRLDFNDLKQELPVRFEAKVTSTRQYTKIVLAVIGTCISVLDL